VDEADAPDAGRSTEWSPSEWSWPPEAPWHPAEGSRFLTDDWAPATAVRRPWVRVGRWTLLYRR
jgi:hypothetical protein